MMEAAKGGVVIKPIDKASVHRICSGQVILDLSMAVKELVENSLDAGSTSIEIKLKDYGAESFEVADNGCGVSPDNYQALTLKYHTSKISEFADLQSLSSFGFRGEALSSLCALGDLSVVTRTKNEPIATQLQFDRSGLIISQKSEARPVGTTVIVCGLFKSLPVRHKEFTKNIRREYSRLLTVLHGYALMAKNVRLVCTHLTGKTRTVILKTQGTSSIKDNIITVFGTKMAACLEPVDLLVGSDCKIEGFVSKPGSGSGRASGDRQFFYINNRPVELPKVSKMLNELYRSFNSLQYPMAVLNLILPSVTYDVNVTPDKRKVFLHAEDELLLALKRSLESVYAPEKYTFAVHKLESTVLEKESSMPRELPEFETQKCDVEEVSLRSAHVEELSLRTASLRSAQVELSDDDNEDLDSPGRNVRDANADSSDFTCKSSASRADLDSFQCNISVVSTKLNNGLNSKEREEKTDAGLRRKEQVVVSSQQKVVQSKLTGFVMPAKRPAEDRPLSSEEPLLKKWMLSHHGIKENKDSTGCRGGTLHSGPRDVHSEIRETDPSKNYCDERPKPSCCFLEQNGSTTSGEQSEGGGLLERNTGANQSPGSLFGTLNNDCCMKGEGLPERNTTANQSPGSLLGTSHNDVSVPQERHMLNDGEQLEGGKLPERNTGAVPSLGSLPGTWNNDVSVPEECCEMGTKASHGGSTSLCKDPEPIVGFDLKKLRARFDKGLVRYEDYSHWARSSRKRRPFLAASMGAECAADGGSGKEEALAAATREFERTFNKVDFKKMKVLGQFNLGFILAKLDDDLFIIDQHASDEKYNFERLSKTTVLNRQPLLRPLPLDLSAAEEVIVAAHIETFRKNGFDFVEDKDGPPGRRLLLSAVPFSKNITFGDGDVQEMVSVLAEEPTSVGYDGNQAGVQPDCDDEKQEHSLSCVKSLVRPSRVRAMLASRACRSSIMIGDALSKKEMQKVVSHLAELDSPWNCPHGRPTMRHLVDLTNLKQGARSTAGF